MTEPLSLPNLAQAPLYFQFDGKDLYLSPLCDSDFAEFELWLQERYLDSVKRNAASLPDGDRIEILKHAFDRAHHITLTTVEGLSEMKTLEGGIHLVWLSLKHKHPDMTRAQVQHMMLNEEFAKNILSKLDRLNGGSGLPEELRVKKTRHYKEARRTQRKRKSR